jgi:hypothetical protein
LPIWLLASLGYKCLLFSNSDLHNVSIMRVESVTVNYWMFKGISALQKRKAIRSAAPRPPVRPNSFQFVPTLSQARPAWDSRPRLKRSQAFPNVWLRAQAESRIALPRQPGVATSCKVYHFLFAYTTYHLFRYSLGFGKEGWFLKGRHFEGRERARAHYQPFKGIENLNNGFRSRFEK